MTIRYRHQEVENTSYQRNSFTLRGTFIHVLSVLQHVCQCPSHLRGATGSHLRAQWRPVTVISFIIHVVRISFRSLKEKEKDKKEREKRSTFFVVVVLVPESVYVIFTCHRSYVSTCARLGEGEG